MLLSLNIERETIDWSRRVVFCAVPVACLPPRSFGAPFSTR